MNVLLTGSSGFIGGAVRVAIEAQKKFNLSVVVRKKGSLCNFLEFPIDDLSGATEWSASVSGQDTVIHIAAIAHIVSRDPSLFHDVNVAGTINLARQAAFAGVRRFIFISSIGVNGSISERPFSFSDQPNPVGLYALSKWEAEQGLWRIQHETGMEVVVVRPPLVYGPGAPGSFVSLVRWIEKGIPLPLGAIDNKRSLVGIDNLIDLIIRCIDHPAAANQVFLAGDGEDLSTTELLRGVGKAMGKPARLIPVPAGVLQLGATLLGKRAMAQRLLGSLQVDISKTCELLDWKPPYTVEEGLRRCFERSN